MSETPPVVVNARDQEERTHLFGDHWGGSYKDLTPALRGPGGARVGRLGVNETRLPPGRALCPFHYHQRENEVFYMLRGRGVLRYGDEFHDIGPGDCVSCPAGSQTAHQIANPYDEDLVYLAIGDNDADEVAVYPDSGKVLVRSIGKIGLLEPTEYMHGEGDVSPVFAMIAEREG
ncbi:MAG: cupin domain-containing protein [Proteobacteria bacterium]|nr:cupin domain-containing protein [Pseudomonadota bacterium]